MDIHQLELFLAVMESSSMTRAAGKFYLSPAAVSFQLHNLAGELNTELFVRTGKKVTPTPAARRLAEHARAIVKLTSQIKQEFEDRFGERCAAISLCHGRDYVDLSAGPAVAAVAETISEGGYPRDGGRDGGDCRGAA
jgi:DNA-binding transcriptional LysR family regulator